METELRKTGINIVGDMPWGTHFCHFYETKQDLLDILIPYFKTGLENNEFCTWVIFDPLDVEEAANILRRAFPEADRHLTEGNIEIISYLDWYLKDGKFDSQYVINQWQKKLTQALAKGFDGLRVNGIESWLTEENWKDFSEYEKKLNKLLANRNLLVLCTYPLEKSSAAEIFDVAGSHQFIVAIRNGNPEILETPALKQAKDEIKKLNKQLEQRIDKRTAELAETNEELKKEIVERKRVEAAERESRHLYESLVHSIDGIVWEVDAETFRFTFVSKQAERILGYPLARWLEPNFWADHLHSDDRHWAVGFCLDAVQRRVDHQFEYRMIASEGRTVWLRDIVTVNVMDDKSVRLRGVMVDITESKHSEKEMQKLMHVLAERVKELTALHDASRILQQEWTNTSTILREMVSLLPSAFQYPKITAARIRLGQTEAVTAGFTDSPTVLRAGFTTSDGQAGSIEVVYIENHPTRDKTLFLVEEKAVVNTLADMLRNSYDWWKSQEKLRQSEKQLSAAQQLAHFGSWNWDIENNVVIWSDEVYRIFGLKPQEFGSTFEAYLNSVHPEDRDLILKVVENSLGKNEPFSFYYRIIRPDGEVRILFARRNVITGENGNPVRSFGILQDVTERVQAEEQLKSSNEMLRALAARLQSVREEESIIIAREIHDELGSALTGLKMDIAWSERHLPADSNKPVHQKFKDMSQLIDETIQKVRNISTELRPAILDDLGLAAAIEWQCREFQRRTEIKCRITSLYEEAELSAAKATAVFRIYKEILTNVARHSRATLVETSFEERGGDLILKVSDNGIGIKESDISDTKSLGLLGMFERAVIFGGKVEITGAEGKGTTVTVLIPRE